MSLTLFSRHFDYGEGLVAFSALEAGGYNPVFGNLQHCSNATLYMEAFGGMQILLPVQQIDAARDWLDFIRQHPLTDYDPIPRRKFGKWKRGTVLMTGYCLNPFALLIFFLPLWAVWALFISAIPMSLFIPPVSYEEVFFGIVLLIFPAILTHAKYIAGPKLVKKEPAHVA